jgi:hypothetical protein
MLHPSCSLPHLICQLLFQHDRAHQVSDTRSAALITAIPRVGSLAVPVKVDFCCVVGEMLSINKRGTVWLDA